MARITVEDCLDKVDNRFELVMIASKRARALATGGKEPLVSADSDKPTVIALREIADDLITAEEILHPRTEEQNEMEMLLEAEDDTVFPPTPSAVIFP